MKKKESSKRRLLRYDEANEKAIAENCGKYANYLEKVCQTAESFGEKLTDKQILHFGCHLKDFVDYIVAREVEKYGDESDPYKTEAVEKSAREKIKPPHWINSAANFDVDGVCRSYICVEDGVITVDTDKIHEDCAIYASEHGTKMIDKLEKIKDLVAELFPHQSYNFDFSLNNSYS